VPGAEPAALGTGLVLFGAVVALATSFALRTLLAAPAVVVLLVAAGAAIGWGGTLLQPDPSGLEATLAIAALAVLVPVHVRVVFGPFGHRGRNGPGARRRG